MRPHLIWSRAAGSTAMMCHLCKTDTVTMLLDLGMQPICNRFLAASDDKEFTHPMRIGQCDGCGLIQIVTPTPAHELRPRYDWITYMEPEGHLDQLSDAIASLPGLSHHSTICGVSFKDDSTLRRLNDRGFHHTWRVDPTADLGVQDRGVGVETVQDRLTPEIATQLAGWRGRADVVIARQILEHAHDVQKFMEALKQLTHPNGYIIFESPDCTRGLNHCDYSTLWEEHIVYFTPTTFQHCLLSGGFSIVHFERFPYPLEDSLVGVVRVGEMITRSIPSDGLPEEERCLAVAFAEGLEKQRDRFHRFFTEHRKKRGKVVLFGAGHLACTFINLLQLSKHFEFVVDDHPSKKGLFMPGSRLPIRGSDVLLQDREITLCLLSLNPERQERVIQSQQGFLERGGVFYSIFPESERALQL